MNELFGPQWPTSYDMQTADYALQQSTGPDGKADPEIARAWVQTMGGQVSAYQHGRDKSMQMLKEAGIDDPGSWAGPDMSDEQAEADDRWEAGL